MPRLPKQEAFAKALKNHMVRPKYPPIPEEKLNKYPYFQCNLGLHLKQLSVGGELRHYGVYVPDGMIGKGFGRTDHLRLLFRQQSYNLEVDIRLKNTFFCSL